MSADRESFLKASWVNVASNVVKIGVEGFLGVTFGSLALMPTPSRTGLIKDSSDPSR